MGKSLTHSQKVIAITTIITALVIGIVNLTLAGVAYQKTDLSQDQAVLDELLTNWKAGPILDIKIDQDCPGGYEAVTKQWPGVKAACYCKGVTSVNCGGDFCPGQCTSDMIVAGCADQPGRAPQALKYFGYNLASATAPKVYNQICVKRSPTESFFSNGVMSAGICPEDYRTCGTNDDTKFCTKESKCPVIAIRVISPFTASSTPTEVAQGLGACKLSPAALAPKVGAPPTGCVVVTEDAVTPANDKFLIFFNSEDGAKFATPVDQLPTSQLRINEAGMCYNSFRINVSPNRLVYPQLINQQTSCNDEAADIWGSAAFTISEEDMFTYNDLQNYISKLAPFNTEGMEGYYNTGADGTSYTNTMYQQPYVSWHAKHRGDMKTFTHNTNLIPRIEMSQKGYLGLTVIAAFFLFVVVIVEILKLAGKVDPNGTNSKITKGINIFFKFAQLPLILWSLLLCAVGKHYFEKISHEKVSEKDYVNDNFALFAEHLKQAVASTAVCLALAVAGLIIDIALHCYGKKAAKNNSGAHGVQRIESENNGLQAKASSSQAIDHESPTKIQN